MKGIILLKLVYKIVKIIFRLIIIFLAITLFFFHQIDWGKTAQAFFKGKIGWIAIIDKDAIYQNGQIVGNISGNIQEKDGRSIFSKISNTDLLKRALPFQYRRDKFRIIEIGLVRGMGVVASSLDTKNEKDVIENVICEKVK
jgi:hypothetical protein